MAETPCSDLSKAEEILGRYPQEEPALIQVLQDVHRAYNYLPCDVLERVAEALEVPLAKVFSVSTFYKAFSLEPQGDTIVKVCTGTACHIRGAGQLVEELERQLGVGPDETTEDFKFTVKTVNCVGACAMAPLVIVGEKYFGSAKPARVSKYLTEGGADEN
ncbi:MAG: NAD(P)H-dependent oxidoreductase subunit E [Acidobacteria bacterium]|uniref:NAD(P)H-dependent oxidoreductase subunit E n=1 Tax=Candidatus Sulfomarinibacter kjeldsenii TaxID=2885994 RepID=A0A8J6Y9N5_9BACT|nr:NAD(P)H-dependent oxidoreductase subunit E [Candidatus Sulfomarinibacter kjeldsenii]MBD3869830.1 NAD(P)H-dependent oxidoreductase subunit E [Candidatus Sulfomarinibacter kjeldsenii]